MNRNILHMILLASTISAVHCRSGGGRSSGGSSSRGSSNGGRSSGGSSSGGSSKSGSWFSTGGNSRNSYKPKYTPTHSNKWPSSSSSSNSDESSYKPHYTPSLDMPSHNYGNFNSDSSSKNDYNNFSNGYMTGRILAEIAAINRLKLNGREFDIQTETEKPLANNQFYLPFNMDINDPNIFVTDAKAIKSKFITGYNEPGKTPEAPSSFENIRPQTQEDQTDKITDSCTEICDIFPLEMTTNKIHNEDISSTIEPSVEIPVKSFYQKITSTVGSEKSTDLRSTEIRNSNKENCDSIETTTNKDNKQDSTATIMVSKTENSMKYPRFDMDFDDPKILLADAKTIKIKSLFGYNDPQGKTENNDPFEIATNRIIKKHIPTTTIDPNLDTSTKWYYRKFSTTTPLPICRRVMNSFLNNKGEIIDSVTEVCDPPTTTTTTKPLWKMTTVKPVTTSTAKPYVTVCRPVMDSFLNENGEIIDSVKEVCTLEPVT